MQTAGGPVQQQRDPGRQEERPIRDATEAAANDDAGPRGDKAPRLAEADSTTSGEMDERLDGALPDLLSCEDPSGKRRHGIHFQGVTLTVRTPFRGKKDLLTNVSGHFPSGQLTAVIGPSGSGKSSLLTVLAGQRRLTHGEVAPHGQRRRLIAQQSVFPEALTPLEALTAAANLKLKAPPADRRAAVRRLLNALSLTQCARTPGHLLSGGQRKRLSVALELVDEPPVLLLDEPTTGLDCVTGLQCMRLLQRLARSGSRTIVCSIHQPSARLLELVDNVYLLAAGRCVYRGPTEGLLPKLSSHGLHCPPYHNPADFALDVACGEYGTDVVSKLVEEASYVDSFGCGFEDQEKERGPATSFWNQFTVLTKRSIFIIFQEKTVMYVKIVVHLVVALMLGLLFLGVGDDASRALNNGALYVCVLIFLLFTGLMPTILTFPLEKRIFKSEFSNCWYSLEAYFLALFVSNVPLPLFNASMFTAIVYWMSGQPCDSYIFLVVMVASSMSCLNAHSMGLLIGTVAGLSNGMFLGPLSGVPQFVFCGYFIALSGTPLLVRAIAHTTSYTLYAMHAIIVSTFGNDRPKMQCHETYCYFRSPSKLIEFLDMKEGGVALDLAALFIFMFVIQFATYLVMKVKYRHLQR